MDSSTRAQIAAAYRVMAEAADWRPYGDAGQLGTEANAYAAAWWADERTSTFDGHDVGQPAHRDRPALVFLIEAARALRIGNRVAARDLIELAQMEMAPDSETVTA